MRSEHTVLIVDDEEFVRDSLVEVLECEGFHAITAADKRTGLQRLEHEDVSVVVTDLRMPAGDGLSLLEAAREAGFDTPVILLTGVGTIADAVSAMRAGAFDFVEKPVEPAQFVHLVRRAVEHRDLMTEVRYLRHAVDDLRGASTMVGSSTGIEKVRSLIHQVARSDATVLVTGESGTGKELVASEIHRASRRAARNLVRVNCAAVTESLFESEFFGHRRGAFTGAIADRDGRFAEARGGTLVLDEIGTLRPAMQAKLLRALETGEYQVVGESRTRVADVRVVAMTNEDLPERVSSGDFRADLFYRLNVFPIAVPPLRARKSDIPELAEFLLERLRQERALGALGPNRDRLDEVALDVLSAYDWPGNVRELKNVLERAAILSHSKAPDAHLFEEILGQTGRAPRRTELGSDDDLHLRRRIDDLERHLVAEALARSQGRKAEAAKLLGIDAKNISYYIRKHAAPGGDDAGAPESSGR